MPSTAECAVIREPGNRIASIGKFDGGWIVLPAQLKAVRTTLAADLAAGTLYGVIMLLQGVTLGALIFGPSELEPVTGLGMRAILMSFVVMNLIVALTSSYHFATSGP